MTKQHADVAGDGQHQLAEILRLLGALGKKFQLGELGDAVDQTGDLVAEILLDVVIGDQRVLDRVVQQRGDDGGDIELELGQDGGHFQGMGEIGIARGAELLAMRRHGIDIGLVEQRLVGAAGHRPVTRSTRSAWRISLRRPRLSPKAAATAAAIPPVRAGGLGTDGALMAHYIGNPGFFPTRTAIIRVSACPSRPEFWTWAGATRERAVARERRATNPAQRTAATLRSPLQAQAAARRGAGLRWSGRAAALLP